MALSYSQLPVNPEQPQPQMGGGQQEQQMQQILQRIAQQAADPAKRLQMAQVLARQLPPPPDNIFGQGMRGPAAPKMPQQPQQQNPMAGMSGLGALMQPQSQQMMTPPTGMFTPGGNNQAAVTMAPTNGMAAMTPMQTVPGLPLVPRTY